MAAQSLEAPSEGDGQYRLPIAAVDAPSLEELKTKLNGALGSLIQCVGGSPAILSVSVNKIQIFSKILRNTFLSLTDLEVERLLTTQPPTVSPFARTTSFVKYSLNKPHKKGFHSYFQTKEELEKRRHMMKHYFTMFRLDTFIYPI